MPLGMEDTRAEPRTGSPMNNADLNRAMNYPVGKQPVRKSGSGPSANCRRLKGYRPNGCEKKAFLTAAFSVITSTEKNHPSADQPGSK